MDRTRVFRNGGSLAVRLPKKYALPVGEVMIEERNGTILIQPMDDKGWPIDLVTRLSALADLEIPDRPKDSRSVEL